jgi:hypothetical protein
MTATGNLIRRTFEKQLDLKGLHVVGLQFMHEHVAGKSDRTALESEMALHVQGPDPARCRAG